MSASPIRPDMRLWTCYDSNERHVAKLAFPSLEALVRRTMKQMTTISETVRRLLLAHFQGDEAAFRTAAREFVDHERRVKHGAVADDLERILSTANGSSHHARRDFLTLLGSSSGNLPKDKDRNAQLVELSEPQRSLDDLILSARLRHSLDRIVAERRNAEVIRAHGIAPVGKMLFCGPPGCGKSVAAEAMACELALPLATVRFDAVVSSYLGETASNLRKVFDFARGRPLVLLFDEFDAIGKHRTAIDEHGELKRVVNSFLQLLDSFHAETITIAATNHQGLLDPALWRRFDEILFFAKPSAREREELLTKLFHQFPVGRTVRLAEMAQQLEGFSHADVERVAADAIKQTLLADRKQVDLEVLRPAIDRQRERQQITSSAEDCNEPNGVTKRRSTKKTRKSHAAPS